MFGTDADSVECAGLDHVLLNAAPIGFDASNPFHVHIPFHCAIPLHARTRRTVPTSHLGAGGRQPVAYVGPAPHRRDDGELPGRRPVVAILDTGCGQHPWLDRGRRQGREARRRRDRLRRPATDPEVHGDLSGHAGRRDRPACPVTAPSSPGWCTRPVPMRTSSLAGRPSDGPDRRVRPGGRAAQIAELAKRLPPEERAASRSTC